MVKTTRSNSELRKEVDTRHESIDELKSLMATFFEVDETPPLSKVKLASVYLEGKVLQCHQMYMKGRLTREIPNWEEYIRALTDRFGALVYDDPMSELVNLKQVGKIQQYLNRLDEIVNCLDLPDQYALSGFLGSLKNELSDDSEVDEDKEGGRKLTESNISMHAITGIHDFKTMRVTGVTKRKPIHILIDIGGTHNFIDLIAAKRLGYKLEPMTPFVVSIDDGNKIHSSFLCRSFTWKMQGVKFTADLMTIPLGGCDMVLGIQWLITFGDINWNFSQLKMDFMTENKKKKKGTAPTSDNVPVMLTNHGYLVMEPETVLERRIVQRHGRPATQWLVKQFNYPVEDSTWEFLHELRQPFPSFNP
ncbi:hypothetical protein BUALT_Bualt16G0031900 [Buddleja alternifolia]|uniref:Retrotransposon gag domain-containing protein n=1 Tax=Buddleja alternifolia TaxID=168488 RepID=A0AAV6W8M4_9LAMI|nr:hypothetical protein BUALT_Bualt16G0031900 [Buddleja alternifolia]